VGISISISARFHPIAELDAVGWSRFSFPTFPQKTRKDGAPGKKILLLSEAGTAYLSA
jgi:hypothetical protein